jgi:hypothetical protein
MIKKFHKTTSLALILSLVFPLRNANAAFELVPLTAPEISSITLSSGSVSGGVAGDILADVVEATLASGGGAAANPIGVALGALGVGTAVGYIVMDYIGDKAGLNEKIRMPVSRKPALQPAAPVAPLTGPVDYLCPPDTSGAISGPGAASSHCTLSTLLTYSSVSATSCSASFSSAPLDISGCPSATGSNQPNYATVKKVLGCAAGYSQTGNVCNLTDPRLAKPDHKTDYPVTPNGYSKAPDADKLPANISPTIQGTNNSNIKSYGYIKDSAGNKHQIWVDIQKTAAADAASDAYRANISYIEHSDMSPLNLDGTPTYATPVTTVSIDVKDGQVQGMTKSTVYGEAQNSGSTYTLPSGSTATVKPNELVVTAPNAPGVTTPPVQVTSAPAITPSAVSNFPTDYARVGEAASAAKTITDKLSESDSGADLPAPDLVNPLVDYFNPLRSWVPPSVVGVCPNGSFDALGHTYDFHVMCDLFDSKLPIIQTVSTLLYSLAALFIVLGA